MDPQQTIGEFLGHVAGALSARSGDSPAGSREAALALTFAEAEQLLAKSGKPSTQPGA